MNFASDFQFYLAIGMFAVQVVVVSFYSPWRIRRYYQRLVKHYPPAEYPGLYSVYPELRNEELVTPGHRDTFIGIVTLLAILASLLFWQYDRTNAFIWLLNPIFIGGIYWVVQGILILNEPPRAWQAMRQLSDKEAPVRRSATLQGLKITDYISPILVIFGLATTSSAFILIVYFLVNGVGSHNSSISIVWIVACVFLLYEMLCRTLWAPQFKRLDPFISHHDLFRQRRLHMRTLFGCSGIVALYIWYSFAVRLWIPDPASNIVYNFPMICMLWIVASLFRFWSVVRNLDRVDFSVYRMSAPANT